MKVCLIEVGVLVDTELFPSLWGTKKKSLEEKIRSATRYALETTIQAKENKRTNTEFNMR